MNEEITQTLLQESLPRVLAGVSPEETVAVAAAFEYLLRLAVERDRSYLRPYLPDLDAFTLDIGKTVIKEVLEVAPEKRLEYLQQELLDREISRVSRGAEDLAEKSIYGLPDLPALRAQAQPIQERIEELYREFKEKGMDWERRYGLTLSEANLDCGFVLGKHRFCSLRLGRRIESLKKFGIWPPAWYAELWLKDNDNK